MQYTIFDELVASVRRDELARIDPQRRAEAESMQPHSGVRRSLASALVRLGVSLDRGASERVVTAAVTRAAH